MKYLALLFLAFVIVGTIHGCTEGFQTKEEIRESEENYKKLKDFGLTDEQIYNL